MGHFLVNFSRKMRNAYCAPLPQSRCHNNCFWDSTPRPWPHSRCRSVSERPSPAARKAALEARLADQRQALEHVSDQAMRANAAVKDYEEQRQKLTRLLQKPRRRELPAR
ncbi:MAG: hypothetical protein EBY24_22255 [Betaproteobacteria bacterium]|nr:hypothetical protein [Betaproteobacteria bacterium]